MDEVVVEGEVASPRTFNVDEHAELHKSSST
jgi:hypothetical protein